MMGRRLGYMGAVLGTVLVALLGGCGGGGDDREVAISDPVQRCSSIGTQPLVANGTACVPSASTPVLLLLILDSNGEVGSCSGVKIAPGRVLTAAHCVDASARAVVGVLWDGQGNATQVRAQSWVAHPAFAGSPQYFVNDVAVVSFADPLPSPTVPVLLSQPSAKGQAILLSGWGAPDYVLSVGSALIDEVRDDYLRITYDGSLSNACPGDSGGPATRLVNGRQVVVGLVSAGTGGCSPGGQTYFTHLAKPQVSDFIRSQAAGAELL